MKLLKENAIKTEGRNYIFKCNNCINLIKSQQFYLSKHSGLCKSCCVKKKPFEHLFNKFKGTAKNENHLLEITYNEFLEFTNIKNCHYCYSSIDWQPYNYKNSKYVSGSYFLDRKDNNFGYKKENIAVCCTKCNIAKGNRYTYKEWYGMNEYFRKAITNE